MPELHRLRPEHTMTEFQGATAKGLLMFGDAPQHKGGGPRAAETVGGVEKGTAQPIEVVIVAQPPLQPPQRFGTRARSRVKLFEQPHLIPMVLQAMPPEMDPCGVGVHA